jgi:hypothetical protein
MVNYELFILIVKNFHSDVIATLSISAKVGKIQHKVNLCSPYVESLTEHDFRAY